MGDIIKVEGYTGITAVGWNLAGIDAEQWSEAGRLLVRLNKASQWWLGDWWNACPNGKGAQEIKRLGIEIDPGTASNYGKTCRTIPMPRRNGSLSFSHHTQVCRLNTESLQDEFIHNAVANNWTVKQLREEIDKFREFDDWSDSELERKSMVENGIAVVANCKDGDEHLIQWARDNKVHVFVGRQQYDIGWGNPYELGRDGDRESVCEYHKHYFQYKFSLHEKLETLKGKVLSCYCYPEMCHADHLADLANNIDS